METRPYGVPLCLRHFGYDATKAIDALLARDHSLPLALRRVEVADLTSQLKTPTLPACSFENEELLMSTIPGPQQRVSQPKPAASQGPKEPEGKNVFRGLISLAPVVPPASSAKAEPAEKPVSDVMKKLREALESLKLRASGIENAFEPQFGVNGERLVPMPTAKKYAGIKKLKISEADKIAIRPSAQSTSEESGEEESEGTDSTSAPPPQGRPTRGGRGGGVTTYRRGGGAGNQKSGTGESSTATATNDTSRSGYTGGRQRQMKERHKNAFKQRGADRKMRGAY